MPIYKDRYAVFKDGKEVFRGGVGDTRNFLHTTPYNIEEHAISGEPLKGYIVTEIGKNPREDHYEIVKKQLLLHGNTVCGRDAKYVLRRFDEDGIRMKANKKTDEYGIYYILTLEGV